MEAKGKTVITGGKARSAIGADGHVKGAYIALKDVKAELAKKGKKPGTDVATVTIQNPRDGKAAGVKVKDKASAPNHRSNYEEQNKRYAEERRKQEEKAAADTKVNMAILTAVRTAAAGQALSTEALQWIVMAALAGVQYQDRGALASLHGAKRIDDLMKKVGQLSPDKLTTLALDCAIVHGVAARSHEKPTALMAAAKHFGVDIAAIRKEVAEKPVDTKTASLPLDAEQDEEEAAEA